jgi:hypothetical protein
MLPQDSSNVKNMKSNNYKKRLLNKKKTIMNSIYINYKTVLEHTY